MIFVDSGAWFALVAPSDPHHQRAVRWFEGNREPLLTTDYIVDETLTLFRARREPVRALKIGADFFEGELANIHYTKIDEIRDAWNVFRRFTDKAWSFTDCVSYVVMQKLGIVTACSFDEHFRQFGTVAVVP